MPYSTGALTVALLQDLFTYDPATGNLHWKVQHSNNVVIGSVAGSVNREGYRMLRLYGLNASAHRLVWLWHHGRLPRDQIDHINRDRLDNRIENLRDVGRIVNNHNRSVMPKSGFMGVIERGGKFRARLSIGRRQKHLGTFESPEKAHQAFRVAHMKHHGAKSPYCSEEK